MTGPRIAIAEDWELAQRLIADSLPWGTISARTGISAHRLRVALDPGYAEKHRVLAREWAQRQGKGAGSGIAHIADSYREQVSVEEARRRLNEVPIDTRGFTARMLGDPLPGRSALDAKRAGA